MTLPLFPELDPGTDAARAKTLPALSLARPTPRPLRRRPPLLWLCLHFPDLILEALEPSQAQPCLVVDGEGGSARVVAADHQACSAGVRIGMRLSAALACVDLPCLLRRKPVMERDCLYAAADAAMAFSDRVSLLPGEGLLLEVRGSLRLFGGLDILREQLLQRLRERGHRCHWAVAPTPLAAEWLCRAAPASEVTSLSELSARLGTLPLACMQLPPEPLAQLSGMGLRRMEDLFRLPRAGLSRRWGPALCHSLDRALGRVPDPRPCWRGAIRFHARDELPRESDKRSFLLRFLRRQLESLLRFLRRHDSQIAWLQCRFHHHRAPTTVVEIQLLAAVATVDELSTLLEIRLESIRFPEPVLVVEIVTAPLRARQVASHALFPGVADAGREQRLLERLRTRLGPERVFAMASFPEHRPEASWRVAEPGPEASDYARPDRPLWLLPRPRPLSRPECFRPLAGPERIETGWWEGRDIQRDYYRVMDAQGHEAWVFRDRRLKRWFLHGLFA
ncbi:Y-family DNA polymerase [Natronospira bacteriovora]|uniref:DNA polymerase Y family protein n=1 Tax=Natronospira bacteriovora TaxID=3069753 RepID=A0ABU0W4D6_9GAMM|nr:DNA polymerase Y family protein [Natronospira sp. AB-CW4]MDQ2068883.1 DNA polymerase Y family protein [Natronospira sp. AB-CW4]